MATLWKMDKKMNFFMAIGYFNTENQIMMSQLSRQHAVCQVIKLILYINVRL